MTQTDERNNIMHKNVIKLAPSLLSVDFAEAGKGIAEVKNGGAEYLHLDVMDGFFVPNISFGVPVIASLRKCTDMVFDVHLMISRPERYIESFAKAGADIITIHIESTDNVAETLKAIRSHGCRAGLAIKPGTPAESVYEFLPLCDLLLVMTVEPGFGGQKFMADMLPKAKALKEYREMHGLDFEIEADGGISAKNAAECVKSGVEVLVAGSSCFGALDPAQAAKDILSATRG